MSEKIKDYIDLQWESLTERDIQILDHAIGKIEQLDTKLKKLERENKRLRGFIEKHHQPNRHDHSYFHDDCGLCLMDKHEYEEVQKVLGEK